jgi:MFS transporter, ACS family, 4-hydroxyphenylacetate permease
MTCFRASICAVAHEHGRIAGRPKARPAGIALINCIGIGGGSAIGPVVIGYLKDLTGSFTLGLVYVAVMLIMGVICITIVAAQTRDATSVPNPGVT